jgi:peptidoglycan/LPS O-acetylase OafA/YrhL
MQSGRIAPLDGLRGIAVLAVILFHAFARWPGLVPMPYGSRYAPVFGWGWLGVELFFVISGFVICMTLEKCDSFAQFMGKRWLRLFPAMLVASLLIFTTAPLVNSPMGQPGAAQLLPGLTFIDSRWLALVHGPDSIEGTFWSLYAEMKFYVFAGIVYFTLGRRWVIAGLIGGFVAYCAMIALDLRSAVRFFYLFDVPFWLWFACGALFYEWSREKQRGLFVVALAVGTAATAVPVPGAGDIPNMMFTPFLGLPFIFLFAAALAWRPAQRALSQPALLFLGFISYPLYLVHDHAMIGMILMLAKVAPWIPGLALPILPVGLLIAVAWIIAAHCEKPVRQALLKARRALVHPSDGEPIAEAGGHS